MLHNIHSLTETTPLPILGVFSAKDKLPVILEVIGGALPTSTQSLIRKGLFHSSSNPKAESVAAVLKQNKIQTETHVINVSNLLEIIIPNYFISFVQLNIIDLFYLYLNIIVYFLYCLQNEAGDGRQLSEWLQQQERPVFILHHEVRSLKKNSSAFIFFHNYV